MITINLLPVRAAQKRERMVSQLAILGVVLGVVVAGCVVLQLLLGGKIDDQRTRIAEANQELVDLNKKIGEVNKVKSLQQELQGKLDILADLKGKKTGPVRLLDELSKAVPDKVWVTSFKESSGKIAIEGFGITEEVVAEFMRRLEESPYYRGVELQVTERTGSGRGGKGGGLMIQKFSLLCQTEQPPAS